MNNKRSTCGDAMVPNSEESVPSDELDPLQGADILPTRDSLTQRLDRNQLFLSDLVEAITTDNVHIEISTGHTVGRETW